jgi:hypothetical protein
MATRDRLLITGGHVFTPAGIVEEPVLVENGCLTRVLRDLHFGR